MTNVVRLYKGENSGWIKIGLGEASVSNKKLIVTDFNNTLLIEKNISDYIVAKSFFHTFQTDEFVGGLSWASEDEATAFSSHFSSSSSSSSLPTKPSLPPIPPANKPMPPPPPSNPTPPPPQQQNSNSNLNSSTPTPSSNPPPPVVMTEKKRKERKERSWWFFCHCKKFTCKPR